MATPPQRYHEKKKAEKKNAHRKEPKKKKPEKYNKDCQSPSVTTREIRGLRVQSKTRKKRSIRRRGQGGKREGKKTHLGGSYKNSEDSDLGNDCLRGKVEGRRESGTPRGRVFQKGYGRAETSSGIRKGK